jgi:NAD(P)-dependent dehydrogenase (short-subunit alcohol dehydrogenase family)
MSQHTPTKIALITGANKGIGYEIARQLGKKGIAVLLGARDFARGTAAAEVLQSEGISAQPIVLDVTDDASVAQAALLIEKQYGRLDILVNNAGITDDRSTTPTQKSVKDFQVSFDTNFFGPIRVLHAMLPLIRKAPAGRIVNMSSGKGSLTQHAAMDDEPHITTAPYNASKAALNRVMLDYAKELRDTPIKINNVCPGFVSTDLNNHAGVRTPEEGARIAVKMALLPSDGPTGTFQNDEGIVPW